MNFDFLKNLSGLGILYENCTNAEKLALTMPVQSVFTSRKSAEQLAKFIYLTSHKQKIDSMPFVDILNDQTVRDFIHDRSIMNAFHSIRKSGNRAVHEDARETVEEAIEVLEDLHYITGEIACILGLIDDYPAFNDKIDSFPEAVYSDDKRIEEKATEMFLKYAEKYDAQVERDHYYQNKLDDLIDEYDSMRSHFILIPGDVDLNEVLEFKQKPKFPSTIKAIQAYFGFLGIRALKNLRGELKGEHGELENRKLTYSCKLIIYGEDGYTTDDLSKFVYGILHDLPFAEGFKIISYYHGPSVAPWFGSNSKERKVEFNLEISEIGQQEDLKYSFYEFLYNHGAADYGKFEHRYWIDLEKQFSNDIIKKEYTKELFCWNVDLGVEFDYEKYPEILSQLRKCVKKHVPEDEYQYCDPAWEDDPQQLIVGVSWHTNSLRTVQAFLDEVNAIIEPIKDECDCGADGFWYYPEYPFAVASWGWNEEGFKVFGTEF